MLAPTSYAGLKEQRRVACVQEATKAGSLTGACGSRSAEPSKLGPLCWRRSLY
jgi:hypothetical protein